MILSLDQLDYWNKKKHKGETKRTSTVGPLRNDGRFFLPNNFIKERGISSSIGVGTTGSPVAPPSEPCKRISRTRLSSWWFTPEGTD